jgi:adenine-specific DNA-methyltransferase
MTIWPRGEVGDTSEAKRELKKLIPENVFETPKPVRLIDRILTLGSQKDSLVMDFFAGSGTTGHAVMEKNAEDGGSRRFILVELADPCPAGSSAQQAGYGRICDITGERLRRAVKRIHEEFPNAPFNDGFRVLRLENTNEEKAFANATASHDTLPLACAK